MGTLNEHDLIYYWNVHDGAWKPGTQIEFDDETLRDRFLSLLIVGERVFIAKNLVKAYI